jgi:hypothetical protein
MNSTYLYVGFFCLAIFIDYLIVNNFLGLSIKKIYLSFRNSSYIYIILFLFIIFLIIFFFCFNLTLFDINYNDINNFILNMVDKKDIEVGTNSTVNVNNPKFSATIGDRGINNIAAALSSAGGATVGLKTAQYVGGTPTTKLAVGLATMGVVQASTSVMSKILNKNNSNNTVNKFVANLVYPKNNNTDNVLDNYPLNLITDINLLLYSALLFLIVIFNIYLANYLSTINYNKYIPNNKLGKLLNILISRYINL